MESVYERNKDNPNHIVLVSKENDKVVGTLLAVICEMYFGQCKSFMVVEDFVVDENHRNKGIGTALMSEIETLATKRNCSYIMRFFVVSCGFLHVSVSKSTPRYLT
jgi:GNAT superfamily N-acetyltransferase